jgi:transposase-like protein
MVYAWQGTPYVLDDTGLKALCGLHNLSEETIALVEDIRNNPPRRRVRANKLLKNSPARFPSKKMGHTIQAESRTLELASIYQKEFDNSVLEYWDQPYVQADLNYLSKTGKKVRAQSTLDFFVLSEHFVGFEEWKPWAKLEKEAVRSPDRFRYAPELGRFVSPALERFLEPYGLAYRICTEKDINPVLVENMEFLRGYFSAVRSEDYPDRTGQIRRHLQQSGFMSLEALIDSGKFPVEDIYCAIADRLIFSRLDSSLLTEPGIYYVSASADDFPEQTNFENPEASGLPEQITDASPEQIAQAIKKLNIIRPILDGQQSTEEVVKTSGFGRTTIYRWLKQYRSEGGLTGLYDSVHVRGNRVSKLPAAAETIIDTTIREKYLTTGNKSQAHVYKLICAACADANLERPAKNTVRRRIDSLSKENSNRIRRGNKAAYQHSRYQGFSGDRTVLYGCNRFLQRCHIDHTQCDVEITPSAGLPSSRPWLTCIKDEFTGMVLSVYFSFSAPSRVSVMSALRLMVFKHGVFPEAVVVDGGKEFSSIYFEKLMARYNCTIIERTSNPRKGGSVEREIDRINNLFFHQLTGNTQLTKDPRSLSRSHNPKSLTIWTLPALMHAAEIVVERLNNIPSRQTGLTPIQTREQSQHRHGIRPGTCMAYDQSFVLDTLLEPKRSQVKLTNGATIQVNRIEYWHNCMHRTYGEKADVKFDPFNLNHVYVRIRNEWIKFTATRQQQSVDSPLAMAMTAASRLETLRVSAGLNEEARIQASSLVELLEESVQPLNGLLNADPLPASDAGFEAEEAHPKDEQTMENDPIEIWSLDIPESEYLGD